jgi:site-specific recombinase XerD
MSQNPSFRMELFMDYLSFERGLSDRTLSAYRHDLDKLFRFLEEGGHEGPEGCSPTT